MPGSRFIRSYEVIRLYDNVYLSVLDQFDFPSLPSSCTIRRTRPNEKQKEKSRAIPAGTVTFCESRTAVLYNRCTNGAQLGVFFAIGWHR